MAETSELPFKPSMASSVSAPGIAFGPLIHLFAIMHIMVCLRYIVLVFDIEHIYDVHFQ